MAAGVTATGIRGALGISLPAANAAKAFEPCGVRDKRTGTVVAGFETLAVVDAVLGLRVVVTAVDSAGLLVVVRVVVLVVNAGGEDLDGVMVTPEDEKDGVLLLLLANKPLPPCSFFNRASTVGLKSAGIKIRIGLWVSIQSPRCPGLSEYNSARLSPVILATSFKFTAPTLISRKCGRLAIGGKDTP